MLSSQTARLRLCSPERGESRPPGDNGEFSLFAAGAGAPCHLLIWGILSNPLTICHRSRATWRSVSGKVQLSSITLRRQIMPGSSPPRKLHKLETVKQLGLRVQFQDCIRFRVRHPHHRPRRLRRLRRVRCLCRTRRRCRRPRRLLRRRSSRPRRLRRCRCPRRRRLRLLRLRLLRLRLPRRRLRLRLRLRLSLRRLARVVGGPD
jgi:hypothetical protein